MHEEPKQFFERRIQVLKNNIIIFSSHLVLYNLFKDLKQQNTELAAKKKKLFCWYKVCNVSTKAKAKVLCTSRGQNTVNPFLRG